MEASFCITALEEALARHGKPEIFNTDRNFSQNAAREFGVVHPYFTEGV
jgi:putative transposase